MTQIAMMTVMTVAVVMILTTGNPERAMVSTSMHGNIASVCVYFSIANCTMSHSCLIGQIASRYIAQCRIVCNLY